MKLSNIVDNISEFHNFFENNFSEITNDLSSKSNQIRNYLNQNIYDEYLLIDLIKSLLTNFELISKYFDYSEDAKISIIKTLASEVSKKTIYDKLFSKLKQQWLNKIKFVFTQENILNKHNEITGKNYFVNGIKCCYVSKYGEYFCSIKNGRPSNIRDTFKTARKTSWDRNILKIINKPWDKNILQDYYPDTTWGSTGTAISFKEFKNLVQTFINS